MRIHQASCLVVGLVATGLITPAHAQDGRQTKLLLTEIATRVVEQDLLVAQLRLRAEAGSGEEARDLVDAAMHAATERVTASKGIRHLSKGGYRVFQGRDDGAGAWIAEQDVTIKARESLPLLQLVGDLQADGLLLDKLVYELSREGRRTAEGELAMESIEALRARGNEIAEKVGMQVDWIETLRVAGTLDGLPVQLEVQAPAPEAESEPLPIALPRRETVGVTVEAELSLIRP